MVLVVSAYNQKAELYTIFEIRLKNVVHLTQKVTWLERWHVTGPDDHFYYIPQLKGKDEYDNDDRDRSVEEITLMCTTLGHQHNISMV